jgi:hypothetical protein
LDYLLPSGGHVQWPEGSACLVTRSRWSWIGVLDPSAHRDQLSLSFTDGSTAFSAQFLANNAGGGFRYHIGIAVAMFTVIAIVAVAVHKIRMRVFAFLQVGPWVSSGWCFFSKSMAALLYSSLLCH